MGETLGADVGGAVTVIVGLAAGGNSTNDVGDEGLPYEGDDGAAGAEGARPASHSSKSQVSVEKS